MAHELSGLFVCQSEVLNVCITEYNEKAFVDGILEEGELKRLIKQTCKKMQKSLSAEKIADDLAEEDNVVLIQKIMDVAKASAPEYDVDTIYEKVAQSDLSDSLF